MWISCVLCALINFSSPVLEALSNYFCVHHSAAGMVCSCLLAHPKGNPININEVKITCNKGWGTPCISVCDGRSLAKVASLQVQISIAVAVCLKGSHLWLTQSKQHGTAFASRGRMPSLSLLKVALLTEEWLSFACLLTVKAIRFGSVFALCSLTFLLTRDFHRPHLLCEIPTCPLLCILMQMSLLWRLLWFKVLRQDSVYPATMVFLVSWLSLLASSGLH